MTASEAHERELDKNIRYSKNRYSCKKIAAAS